MPRCDPHVFVVSPGSLRHGGPRVFVGHFFCAVSLVCTAAIRSKTVADLDSCLLERGGARFSRAPRIRNLLCGPRCLGAVALRPLSLEMATGSARPVHAFHSADRTVASLL